ncbi:hypothetical protein BDR26DRAFT_868531 [Obelidium mucronatum]|nr:hypothetical protein BDR26DRAFT_868531 [Obelidium mucronatum]
MTPRRRAPIRRPHPQTRSPAVITTAHDEPAAIPVAAAVAAAAPADSEESEEVLSTFDSEEEEDECSGTATGSGESSSAAVSDDDGNGDDDDEEEEDDDDEEGDDDNDSDSQSNQDSCESSDKEEDDQAEAAATQDLTHQQQPDLKTLMDLGLVVAKDAKFDGFAFNFNKETSSLSPMESFASAESKSFASAESLVDPAELLKNQIPTAAGDSPVSVIIEMCDPPAGPPAIQVTSPSREQSTSSWLQNLNLLNLFEKPKTTAAAAAADEQAQRGFAPFSTDNEEMKRFARSTMKTLRNRSHSYNPSTSEISRPSSRTTNSKNRPTTTASSATAAATTATTTALLSEKTAIISNLQKDQQSMICLLAELRLENKSLGSQLYETKETLKTVEMEHGNEIKKLKAEVQVSSKALLDKDVELRNKDEELTKKDAEVQQKNEDLEKKDAELQTMQQKLEQTKIDLEKQISSESLAKTEIANEFQRFKEENAKQKEHLESSAKSLSDEVASALAEERAKKLEECEKLIVDYKAQIEILEASKQTALLGTNAAMEQVQAQYSTAQKHILELTTKLSSALAKIQELENENEDLNTSLEESHTKINNLENQLDLATQSHIQLRAVLESSTNERNEAENQLQAEKIHSQGLEGQILLEKTKSAQITEASKTEHPDLSEFLERISCLEETGVLEKSVQLLSAEAGTLKATNADLQKHRSSRISELWNELQTAKKDGDDKATQLAKLQKEFQERILEIQEINKAELTNQVQTTSTDEMIKQLSDQKTLLEKEKELWNSTCQQFEQQAKDDAAVALQNKDTVIKSLQESINALNLELEKVKGQNSSLNEDGMSFMNEVLSELMVRSVAESDSGIGKIWVEEWLKKGAPLQATNILVEISHLLNNNDVGHLDPSNATSLEGLKEIAQLESVCREFEVFAQDAIQKYHAAKSETELAKSEIREREHMIIRLHHILEDGASLIGKQRLKSTVDAKDVEAPEQQKKAAEKEMFEKEKEKEKDKDKFERRGTAATMVETEDAAADRRSSLRSRFQSVVAGLPGRKASVSFGSLVGSLMNK